MQYNSTCRLFQYGRSARHGLTNARICIAPVPRFCFKQRATAVSNRNEFQTGATFLLSLVRHFGYILNQLKTTFETTSASCCRATVELDSFELIRYGRSAKFETGKHSINVNKIFMNAIDSASLTRSRTLGPVKVREFVSFMR